MHRLSNPSDPLHCWKHANTTDYDYLNGIADRWKHPSIPEPEVALIFKRSDSDQVDMSLLENSLRETIKLVSSTGLFLSIQCISKIKKSPNINNLKYFQEISYLWVAKGHLELSNDTPKSDGIVCFSAQAEAMFVFKREQIPILTGIGICFGCY